MSGLGVRRLVSALLLGALLLAAWAYLKAPERFRPPPAAEGSGSGPVLGLFHESVREKLLPIGGGGGCGACHGEAAHIRSAEVRAFLNLHRVALDCGVCHLTGAAVAIRRFRDGHAVTQETLASGVGGRLFAARREGTAWVPIARPGDGVRLRPEGPPCGECHRRGSPLLGGDGLYDPYRRRVLEDLSVMRWLGGRG